MENLLIVLIVILFLVTIGFFIERKKKKKEQKINESLKPKLSYENINANTTLVTNLETGNQLEVSGFTKEAVESIGKLRKEMEEDEKNQKEALLTFQAVSDKETHAIVIRDGEIHKIRVHHATPEEIENFKKWKKLKDGS